MIIFFLIELINRYRIAINWINFLKSKIKIKENKR